MPPRSKQPKAPTPVEALKHRDTRINIPTEELREFVRPEEEAPTTLLYPRDPSLDPQLVWRGKDDQDRRHLEVPAVPIYIQEKVHSQALIEDLRAAARGARPEAEAEQLLFADFNGLRDKSFEQKIDFYSHEAGAQPRWSNRLILGDSLLVMASLAEKEALKGQVQMIYMDPPYGIKFGSNWQVSTRKRDVKDGKLEDATRQPEQIKAFRDTWELGIHSYLSYLRDRLTVARELLTETGSIFVQIGDENLHLVRSVLDEVFGSDNFCSLISFRTTTALSSPMARVNILAAVTDHLLWYAKDVSHVKYRQLYSGKAHDSASSIYSWLQLSNGERRRRQPDDDPEAGALDARIFSLDNLTSTGFSDTLSAVFEYQGASYSPGNNKHWKTTPQGMWRLARAGRLATATNSLRYVRFLEDFSVAPLVDLWTDTGTGSFTDEKLYVVQTGVKVIERCILMTTDPGDLVLDPTCGSGTTAAVAEQWGRRWITVDTSRVALTLARTRLMTAKYPYYLLADSPEGQKKEAELLGLSGLIRPDGTRPPTAGDVRKGFVYPRVPHVTLKSIANNEEIDAIQARYETQLVPLLETISKHTGRRLAEWEIPRQVDPEWQAAAKAAHAEWWRLRGERQREIDASIARRADTEVLYDQPYEDGKRLRVTGPFTVESLSPHRVLATRPPEETERPDAEDASKHGPAAGQFESMILDNLRKAGVQTTRKAERLRFDRLETFPGSWIQAMGAYTDREGRSRSVAVSIGPEHGTVGPEQIQEAAKEAVRGMGVDLLLVLGFAFDAHAADTAHEISPEKVKVEDGFIAEWEQQYGRLPVQLVRMNTDLSMGDEVLKKTGAGNLFMVFGEPDLEITTKPDGQMTVKIRGVDVYDPTTGQIRSSSTDEIACWFIDTDYNDESFFVRHAYFTGAGDPYEKLKRALKADIDEEAWATLYRTESRPFPRPPRGKIAVKVINHYGDEVLKVYRI
jgi:adenine-specific DNA-methyltransferase